MANDQGVAIKCRPKSLPAKFRQAIDAVRLAHHVKLVVATIEVRISDRTTIGRGVGITTAKINVKTAGR